MDKFSQLILVSLVLIISGCATNQRFDCKQSSGIKCQSLSEIDKRVTSGEIGQDKHKSKLNSLYISGLSEEENPVRSSNLRTKEEVAEIWIAAYETKEGIYHQSNTIHTVLRPAKWVNAVREVEAN